VEILRVSHEVEASQVRELGRRRAGRDAAAASAAMDALMSAARSGANMIPPMIAAASAEVTLGEICDALRAEWGGYTEAPAF
jgi:methylmalonyl-CoA mutase, N-terminal domain